MKAAVFFQKYGRKRSMFYLRKIYYFLFLRNPESKAKYLRDSGAKIGKNLYIQKVDQIGTEPCLVEIGDNVYFSGSETCLLTHDGGISSTFTMGISPRRYDSFGKIKIGNNCFIGIRCIIMKGVTIGDNCIIGAGSVVTKDIPSGSVACGVPARVIESVEDYYDKNKDYLDDTIGWNAYKKRLYLENKYS